jgi:2-amino-4-hydroxy-6-hydroxymethyldihydropteridine diphosphokinase
LEVRTTFTAQQLIKALQWVEQTLGRVRTEKWGPRKIDIDILLYGQEIIGTGDLVIPHPEMHKRRFVLVPMNEIAPYVIHPLYGVSMKGLLDRLGNDLAVERIEAEW